MDRLTERFSNGQAASYWCGSNCKYDHKYCCENLENCPAMEDILEKLAHYEDLEEAGRLIELPCAVGDTVWEVRWWDEVTESKVIDGKTYFRNVRKRKVTKTQFSLSDYKDFGKIVFLTKAEAEAALKERESE